MEILASAAEMVLSKIMTKKYVVVVVTTIVIIMFILQCI